MFLIKPWFTLVVIQESVVSWFKDLSLRLPLRSRRLCGAPYVTGQFTAETPRAQRVEVRPPASVFVLYLGSETIRPSRGTPEFLLSL